MRPQRSAACTAAVEIDKFDDRECTVGEICELPSNEYFISIGFHGRNITYHSADRLGLFRKASAHGAAPEKAICANRGILSGLSRWKCGCGFRGHDRRETGARRFDKRSIEPWWAISRPSSRFLSF